MPSGKRERGETGMMEESRFVMIGIFLERKGTPFLDRSCHIGCASFPPLFHLATCRFSDSLNRTKQNGNEKLLKRRQIWIRRCPFDDDDRPFRS